MIDYQRQVEQALDAAKHHEDTCFDAATRHNVRVCVIYVRAYLWELQSAWDYTLLHANSRTLNLDTRRVRADSFLDRLERGMPAYRYLPALRSIEAGEPLRRVRRLRNESHRFVTHLRHAVIDLNHSVTAFGIAVEESPAMGIIIQRDEFRFLRAAVDKLTHAGFFG